MSERKMRIVSVEDDYIDFLRSDSRLSKVYDNKQGKRIHSRKYLGVVFRNGENDFFIPMSSTKPDKDYSEDGSVRRNTRTIIRIAIKDRVFGTLRLSNMIPVPDNAVVEYDINSEPDLKYKSLVTRQYLFIRKNSEKIIKAANSLYKEKINEQNLIEKNIVPSSYLSATIDFRYAEEKCYEYKRKHEKS